MSRPPTALVSTPSKAITGFLAGTSTPATPTTQVPPSPGTFRHPRLNEIIKRQSASSITSQKIQNATVNAVALVATFVFAQTLEKIIGVTLTTIAIPPSAFRSSALIVIVRILFLVNIALCVRPALPYVSKKDSIADIPLTPTQRALLGLPPSQQGSPAAPAGSAGYVTPPRYRREGGVTPSTPASHNPLAFTTGRRSISANYSSSPVSASRHALDFTGSTQQPSSVQSARTYRRTPDSPFGASPVGSPLLHKAVTNELHQSTFTTVGGRASFGASAASSGFGLGRSQSMRERKGELEHVDSVPGTPSPSGPKRQPGVNYKWLYDKGARLPRSESTGF